jgi:hypothetical protein
LGQEIRGQHLTAPGIKCVYPGNAKCTFEIASRQVKEMRGYELPLLAIFDPMFVYPCLRTCLARTALSGLSVCPASVFAEAAFTVVATRPFEPIAGYRRASHGRQTESHTKYDVSQMTHVKGYRLNVRVSIADRCPRVESAQRGKGRWVEAVGAAETAPARQWSADF